MNIEIRCLSGEDIEVFMKLVSVFEKVFDMQSFMMPPKTHLQTILLKPEFIVFVAKHNDEVIGGLTAYVLHQYYSEKPVAYLYDLAVKPAFQRQGVGKELVAALNAHCRERGFQEVFVQADKADDYAIDFYRKTGTTAEEEVVHFYYALSQ